MVADLAEQKIYQHDPANAADADHHLEIAYE